MQIEADVGEKIARLDRNEARGSVVKLRAKLVHNDMELIDFFFTYKGYGTFNFHSHHMVIQ